MTKDLIEEQYSLMQKMIHTKISMESIRTLWHGIDDDYKEAVLNNLLFIYEKYSQELKQLL